MSTGSMKSQVGRLGPYGQTADCIRASGKARDQI